MYGEDLGVGSHFPVLAAALMRTTGPVLECGVGWWSTPMLHLMCDKKRELVSLDSSREWLNKFTGFVTETHDFGLIDNSIEAWHSYGRSLGDFYKDGVIFLDQSPGESRVPMAKSLKGKFHFLVCHDTCADIPPSGGGYGWEQLEKFFKYQATFREVRPWTTVYSDVEEFTL